MARRVIGLDVGTYSVKVAHLEARARGTGYDIHEYKEILLSQFVRLDEENTEESLQKAALAEVKRLGLADGSWTVSGLSGSQAQIRSLDVPFADAKKIEAVLPGFMDSQLPFSVENLVYTWFPVGEKSVGAHLLVGFARKEAISDCLAQLKTADISPRILTVKAAALYELIVQAPPPDNGTALFAVVDIGHKSTGICVGDKNSMRFARSVPKGGWHVTEALAKARSLSFEQAEIEKHDAKEMSDAIREAYYPIAREIRQTILAMESETQRKVEKVYLVGGGAKTAGLSDFLSSLLTTNVSLVNRFPGFGNVWATESASRLPLSSDAGLAISYALLGEHASRRVLRFNFRKGEFAFSGEFGFMRQRAVALSAFVAILIVMLGFTAWLRSNLLEKDLQVLTQRIEQNCPASRPANAKADERGAKACLSWMKAEIQAQKDFNDFIPDSASDMFIALSQTIGSNIDLKLKSLKIDGKKSISFSAEAQDARVADRLVTVLEQSPCFDEVVKKRNDVGGANAQIEMEMKWNCDKKNAPKASDKTKKGKA